jgi:CubicO group peptidase (beta-lactamase class C family)
MASMALALAHSRGLFDYDDPVAQYWPEFAQEGKEAITVRQLLGHQAGLAAIDQPLDADTLADFDRLAETLAAQKPCWEPGAHHGYHGVTLGWYQGELLRRVDPQHRDLDRFFQEEIARPLGIEFRFGLPRDYPAAKIAVTKDYHPARMALHMKSVPPGMVFAGMNPWSLTVRAFSNPRVSRPGDIGLPPYRHVQIPAGNGFGTARALARAYGAFATGGADLGLQAHTILALEADPVSPREGCYDRVLKTDTAFSLGYMKPFATFPVGSARAYGAPGIGGSLGFAEPELGLGFGYAPNRMRFYLWSDPRAEALREAVVACARKAGA